MPALFIIGIGTTGEAENVEKSAMTP
jgi:hypothetical protein